MLIFENIPVLMLQGHIAWPSDLDAPSCQTLLVQLYLQVTICGPMLAPLVRMLSDHAERCREICVGIIAESLARMPEPTVLIPAILPVLAVRHGASPVQVNMAALLCK